MTITENILVIAIAKCQRAKISGAVKPHTAFSPLLGPTAWHSRWINKRGKPVSQTPLTAEVSAKHQPAPAPAPAPHNTCGSCYRGNAKQFHLYMRGDGGSRITSKSKQGAHIHQPTASPLPHARTQPHHFLQRRVL